MPNEVREKPSTPRVGARNNTLLAPPGHQRLDQRRYDQVVARPRRREQVVEPPDIKRCSEVTPAPRSPVELFFELLIGETQMGKAFLIACHRDFGDRRAIPPDQLLSQDVPTPNFGKQYPGRKSFPEALLSTGLVPSTTDICHA